MPSKDDGPSSNDAVPISAAASLFFPHGGVTVSTLRRAIRRGELKCELVGRGYMVTRADIEAWRELCRQTASKRVPAERTTSRMSRMSAEERMRIAQEALKKMLANKPRKGK